MSLRGLLPLLADRPEFRRLRERLSADGFAPVLSGVTEAAKPYLVAALAAALDRPVLYVVRDNAEVERATDALIGLIGRDFPVLPYAEYAGQRLCVPYGNVYAGNGFVAVPVSGHAFDADACRIVGDQYPGRTVLPVPGVVIAWGGGGVHCITQQVPA